MTRAEYDAALADCLAQLLVAAYERDQKKNPEPQRASCGTGRESACGEKGRAYEPTTSAQGY